MWGWQREGRARQFVAEMMLPERGRLLLALGEWGVMRVMRPVEGEMWMSCSWEVGWPGRMTPEIRDTGFGAGRDVLDTDVGGSSGDWNWTFAISASMSMPWLARNAAAIVYKDTSLIYT